jgi:hypothetical protein
MNRVLPVLIVGSILTLLLSAAGAVWLITDALKNAPKFKVTDSDYEALILRLNGDEPTVRDELNELISTCGARLSPEDAAKATNLTRECLDANDILSIGHIRAYLRVGAVDDASAYHFVSPEQKRVLVATYGETPSVARVIAARKKLAALATYFSTLRSPPDWKIEIEAKTEKDIPKIAHIEFLQEAFLFLPQEQTVQLRALPSVPAFSSNDGTLLLQLETLFNGPKGKDAFPPDLFPKAYVNGKLPPLPKFSEQDRKLIEIRMEAEKKTILGDKPNPEAIEAVGDVLNRILQLLDHKLE